MSNAFFSSNANVYLYGDPALHFLGSPGGVPTFQVHGFHDPEILIEDHRSSTVPAIEAFFATRKPDKFYPVFNQPAQVELHEDTDGGTLKVILEELDGTGAVNEYLWIAVGIGDRIPAYHYRMWRIAPIGEDRFAIFSVFTVGSSPEGSSPVAYSAVESREER